MNNSNYINSLKLQYVTFDDDETSNYLAMVMPSTWNGWLRPLIHEDYIQQFVIDMEFIYILFPNGLGTPQGDLLQPISLHGELWYDLSGEGLCFIEGTTED